MCTVVFIPSKEKYFFCSLRDEDPARIPALLPSVSKLNEYHFIAPKDPIGGGTWIGANEYGNIIILLNGGFKTHIKKTSYARSRGLIVTELLTNDMPVIEWNLMDLENIEPFTLIVWTNKKLFQLVWDGKQKHRIMLPITKAHIWSSATLYNEEIKNYREALFNEWMVATSVISKSSLLHFFNQYQDKHNGFLVNRNERIKTLSYTFIEFQNDVTLNMNYRDRISGSETALSLDIQSKITDSICPNMIL